MKIGIAGFGNLGQIYAKSLIKYNLAQREHIYILARSEATVEVARKEGFRYIGENPECLGDAEVVFICVKPQDFAGIATLLKRCLTPNQLLISVMAGVTISQLQKMLAHKNIVRAMPNSPIELGMGMTVYCTSSELKLEHLRKAEQLLGTTGRTMFLEQEQLMDAVTALSGSGPAYFYFFVKCLIEAGVEMGFDKSVSSLLVKQTMLGAYHLLNNSEDDIETLIAKVASKGGTTNAAFLEFEKSNIKAIIEKGILEAEKRGRELSAGIKSTL